jgi:MoxR-like ATPase
VTVERTRHRLADPFFVVATQNPVESTGTYPLPESQLDRFLMRVTIGYPDAASERRLLLEGDRQTRLERLRPLADMDSLLAWQAEVEQVYCSPALIDYVQDLLEYSRRSGNWHLGLSPRAGLGVIRASRAWALLHDRREVIPEHVQAVLPAVAGHRLGDHQDSDPAQGLLEAVPIP